ncbi:MAG: LytR/AlgR family response regulator transcription factor [Salibacteraceae bacterium]
MKAIIIEDEARAARRLETLISEVNPNIKILVKLESIEEAVEYLRLKPNLDIIFSDIELADGLSFEIFKEATNLPPIIFTTAYDQYAIKAFKNNGIDYLLKPVDKIELENALTKLASLKTNAVDPSLIQLISQQLNTDTNAYKERFLVKVGQHLKSILTSEISAFYSMDKATYVFTNSRRNYVVDHSLEQLEEQLNPNHFFRINRNFILHINAPIDILSWSNSRLKIELEGYDEEMIIVSRNKTKEFKQWLGGGK